MSSMFSEALSEDLKKLRAGPFLGGQGFFLDFFRNRHVPQCLPQGFRLQEKTLPIHNL